MSILPPDNDDHTKPAEINVTPMVDIMLVLLVIFMVAAPLMHGHMKINLPQGGQKARATQDAITLLTLDAAGKLFFKKTHLEESALKATLKGAHQDPKKPVYVEADRSLPYGQVVALMHTLSQLGYKLALVTELKTKPTKRA